MIGKEREFYCSLNMNDVTDADHKHTKRVWEDLKLKYLDENFDFYIQTYTLLLADVFVRFRINFIVLYELEPAHFF